MKGARLKVNNDADKTHIYPPETGDSATERTAH